MLWTRLPASILFASLCLSAAACSGATPAPTSSSPSDGPVKPKVDRLVFAVSPPPQESNDVNLAPTSNWATRPMWEHLIAMDAATGKFVPQLATEWRLEPDGKSYRFLLRKGVQFHNGKGEMTAKDVLLAQKATVRLGEVTTTNAKYFDDVLERVEAVNDYEVVFHNRVADADYINQIAELVGVGWEITSAKDYEEMGSFPTQTGKPLAATGAYQFKERQIGSFVRFQRVPYQHWRITPDFPEFEWRYMGEASSRMAALLTGEAHLTALPRDLREGAERQGMKTIRGKVPAQRTFMSMQGLYLKDPLKPEEGLLYPDNPLNDLRVRKALNKAVNRDELNKAYYGGTAETMFLNHFHPTRQAWNPEWERRFKDEYGYDPEGARKLLAEAGYSASRPVKTNMLMTRLPDVAEAEDLQEAIAGYWRSVGVDVTLVTMDATAARNRRTARQFDNHHTIVGTSSHQLYGIFVYHVSFFSTGSTGTYHKEMDAMWPSLTRELDTKKQDEIYRKVGDFLFANHLGTPLFWLPAEAVYNPKFVADWVFPGAISGSWTHLENVKAAR